MAHGIFGDRFLSLREPAWHGLGTTFTDPITATEAVSRSKLDYKVGKFPLYVKTANGLKSLKECGLDQVVVLRQPLPDDDKYRAFGTVNDSYSLVQNRDIGKMLDPLTETWPVETIGALGHGETIFLTLNAGEIEINGGDRVHQYFVVTDNKAGKEALRILFTPVRVVCQNTLVMGISQATTSIALRHDKDVTLDLKFYTSLMDDLRRSQAGVVESFNRMTLKQLVDDQINDILASAYPDPKPTDNSDRVARAIASGQLAKLQLTPEEIATITDRADRAVKLLDSDWTNVIRQRDDARTLLDKFNDEHPKLSNTPWAGWQAVVEAEDYRDGKGGSVAVKKSALFGARAQVKIRSFKTAYSLAVK